MVGFSDFWTNFNKEDNFFINILKKKYEVEISKKPDILFYSSFGYDFLDYNCARIFFTGENIRPNFNLCDYAMGYDWITFGDRYYRLPLYRLYDAFNGVFNLKKLTLQDVRDKAFCNYLYSNANADTIRDEFFRQLSKYKKIDSGGRHLNNLGYRVIDKNEFLGKYKFTICFENSSTPGYTSEKIFQAKNAFSVPIYWGNPLVSKELNNKAFINYHDYGNVSKLVAKVIEIDLDDNAYINMLNEPLFINNKVPEYLKEEEILRYFSNIIDNLPNSSRRNMVMWGGVVENEYKILGKISSHRKAYLIFLIISKVSKIFFSILTKLKNLFGK